MNLLLNWQIGLRELFKTISDVLTAGIAITSFSLLIFTLTFKLHDRVTNIFTIILVCICLIFGSNAFATVYQSAEELEIILKFYWIGIIILPAVNFQFSDAILAMTGNPSHGKRRVLGIIFVFISIFFLIALSTRYFPGELILDQSPTPYLKRTLLSDIFIIYFLFSLIISGFNLIRALRRTITSASRRRMRYLVIGAIGSALGLFPYLLFSSCVVVRNTLLFWVLAAVINFFVGILIVLVAYVVTFFGFPWPDRTIKSRLFRWLMRGPTTASLTLAFTTMVRRLGEIVQMDSLALEIITMVATIVLFEYLVTLFAPYWEKMFFYGTDRSELEEIGALENHLLTRNDLIQFLELILATLCDRLRSSSAFVVEKNGNGIQLLTKIGKMRSIGGKIKSLSEYLSRGGKVTYMQKREGLYLIPLTRKDNNQETLLGLIGLNGAHISYLNKDQIKVVKRLTTRATLALDDRRRQDELFLSLDILTPQVSVIQNLMAAGRFDRPGVLDEEIPLGNKETVNKWVKDALTHLWGGPKFSSSPLLQLSIIHEKSLKSNETASNALREILKEAIQSLKPEGDRQFTSEWILYNIFDLKFIKGMKVRDIARRLAISEADLYRKQRVVISLVASRIIEMENKLRQV